MKFIPVSLFERINSLIQGVEAQGCLLTIRLEAFTCRITKEERHVAATLAQHQQKALGGGGVAGSGAVPGASPVLLSASSSAGVGVGAAANLSPLLQPSAPRNASVPHSAPGALFPAIDFLPPAAVATAEGGAGYSTDAPFGLIGSNSAAAAESSVDDRLVFLVSALNAIHGDGYDFSVLSESDFELLDPHYVRTEIENMLASLPEVCYSASGVPYHHDCFWQAIADVLCPSGSSGGGGGGSGVAATAASGSVVPLQPQQRPGQLGHANTAHPVATAAAVGEDESGRSTTTYGAHRHVFPANPPPCSSSLHPSSSLAAATSSSIEQMFSTCDFFLFKCPSCDPIAQRTVWSNHVFVYSKRQKVMVSILCFGEGNLYRGDDGVTLSSLWRGSAGGAGGGGTGLYGAGGGRGGVGSGGGGGGNGGASEEYYYDAQRERLVVFQSPASYDDQQSQPSTDGEWEGFTLESKNRDFYGY